MILHNKKTNQAVIIDGGINLEGSPSSWAEAHRWVDEVNKNKYDDGPLWGWDCGFKLDYDGEIIKVSSRFNPPAPHYG